jgi:hypothetical protein
LKPASSAEAVIIETGAGVNISRSVNSVEFALESAEFARICWPQVLLSASVSF